MKCAILCLVVLLTIQCQAQDTQTETALANQKGLILTIIEKVNGIIEAQTKKTIETFARIVGSLTRLALTIVQKGMEILNKNLTNALEKIARLTKKAIYLGIDVSVCSAKQHLLYKVVTNLAIPLNACANKQVEDSIKVVNVIQQKIVEMLEKASAFVASVFQCPNIVCHLKKYTELVGLTISLPLDIADMIWQANKVVVKATLDGTACYLKTGEDYISESEPIVQEILSCIDNKIKEQNTRLKIDKN